MSDLKKRREDQVVQMLQLLDEDMPKRAPEEVKKSKADFLIEAEALADQKQNSLIPIWAGPMQWVADVVRGAALRPTLAVLATVFFVVFTSASATVYASQSSLPGDGLYPVRLLWQNTQILFSLDSANDVQVRMRFADSHLADIQTLLDADRYEDVSLAVADYRGQVQSARLSLARLEASDPAAWQDLKGSLEFALAEHAQILTAILATAPDEDRVDLELALDDFEEDHTMLEIMGRINAFDETYVIVDGVTIDLDAGTEIEGVLAIGALVESNVLIIDDGSFRAQRIRVVALPDEHENGNSNENENGGGNENENGGGNENENGGGNENENGGGNENENGGSNENENGGSNENENGGGSGSGGGGSSGGDDDDDDDDE